LANYDWISVAEEEKMDEQRVMPLSIETFITKWERSEAEMAACLRSFHQTLAAMNGVVLRFFARPGVSYSLRPWRNNGAHREFFAIVDVIDDDPAERWLSVCFYHDMITDPHGHGEIIPGGLGGSDGYCFNLYSPDREMVAYILERFREASAAAC
jgi:hypothetical protein